MNSERNGPVASGLLRKPLIVGGNGQLGHELARALADRCPIVPARNAADLTDVGSLRAMLRRYAPSLVINVAAYHHVELCETYPARAFAVNTLGVDELAGLCALVQIPFAHVSTDYVFDGTLRRPYREDDAPNPLSVYGASKYAGELLVRRHGPRWFIFRTSGLYGHVGSTNKGYTFIERVIGQAERGETVRVVNDMVFSPSYAVHAAELMVRIMERGEFGLYHVTNSGECTWFEFAAAAFEMLGLRTPLLPISSQLYESAVKRPAYTPLAHSGVERLGIQDAPSWKQGLAAYLDGRPKPALGTP